MHPLNFSIKYPENLSRGLLILKVLFGGIYVGIPHGIILAFLGIGSAVVGFISFWAILFTGKVPKGMFDYVIGVNRWSMRVSAYMSLMTDQYPPFTLQATPEDAVTYELEYPESLSRGKLILKALFGWIYVLIPHMIVLGFIFIGVYVCIFIAFWAILFTGKYPQGMFEFVEGAYRWTARVNVYFYYTDVYPPFSLK